MAPNAQKLFPVFDKDTPPELQGHFLDAFTALNDHDAAIVALNDKLAALKPGTTNVTNVTNLTTGSGGGSDLPGLGKVNMQTSDYVLQSSDAGALVTMTAAVTTTVTLNFTVTVPFFCFIENFGSAPVILSPNNGATINGGASLDLNPTFYAIVFFDNSNWQAATLPSTTLTLQTNGTPNASQTLLNLKAGSGISLANSGGDVTIANTGGGGGATKTPHVVTGSRTLGSIYQNTNGVDMFVSGYCTTSGGGTGALQAVIGTVTPTQVTWADDFTATLSSGHAGFDFYVPDGYFYELNVPGGFGSAVTGVGLWVEFW